MKSTQIKGTVMSALLMKSQFGLWDLIGALCIVSTVFVLSLHNNKESQQ